MATAVSALLLQSGELDHGQQTMPERSRGARSYEAAAELLMEAKFSVDDDGFMASDPISPSISGGNAADSTSSSETFSSGSSCIKAPSTSSSYSSSASANGADPEVKRNHHLHDSGASSEGKSDVGIAVKKSTAISAASGRMDLRESSGGAVSSRFGEAAGTSSSKGGTKNQTQRSYRDLRLQDLVPLLPQNLLPSTNSSSSSNSRSHCCCPTTNSQHPRCYFSRPDLVLHDQISDRGLPPDSQLFGGFCSTAIDLRPASNISAEDRLHAAMLASSDSSSFVHLRNGRAQRRPPLYKSNAAAKSDAAAVPSPECCVGNNNVKTEKNQPRRGGAQVEAPVDAFRIDSLQQKSIPVVQHRRDSSMDAFRIEHSLQMKHDVKSSSGGASESTTAGSGVPPTGGHNRMDCRRRTLAQCYHKKKISSSSSQSSSGTKQHMLEKLLSNAMIRALGSTDIVTSPLLPRMPIKRPDDNNGRVICSSADVNASDRHRRRHRLASSTSTAAAAADNIIGYPTVFMPKRGEQCICAAAAPPPSSTFTADFVLPASLFAASARCLPAYPVPPTACRSINSSSIEPPPSRSAEAPSSSLHFARCRSPKPLPRLHHAYLQCAHKDGVRCYTMRMKASQEPILLARACGVAAAQIDDHHSIPSAASWPGCTWLYSFHDHARKGKPKRGAGRWRSWIGKGSSNGKVASSDLVGMMSVSRCRSPVDGPNSKSKRSTDIEKKKQIVSEFVLYDAASGEPVHKRCGDASGAKQNSKRTIAQPPCSGSSYRSDADSRSGPKTPEESADRSVPSQQAAAAAAQHRRQLPPAVAAVEKNCNSGAASHIHKLLPGRKSADSGHHGDMDSISALPTDVLLQQQLQAFSSPQFLGMGSYSASNRSSWSLDIWSDSEDSEVVPLLLDGFPPPSTYKEVAAVVIQEPAAEDDDAEEEYWERSARKDNNMNAGENEDERRACGWGLKFLAMDCADNEKKDGGKGDSTVQNAIANTFRNLLVAGNGAAMATERKPKDILQEPPDYTTTTLLLPAGEHGMPSADVEAAEDGCGGGSGRPSTLIERWRSGGRCDCGGWDEGCGLRVWSTDENIERNNNNDHAKLRHGRRRSNNNTTYYQSCSIYAAEHGWGRRKEAMVKLQQCVRDEEEEHEEEEAGNGGGTVALRLSFQSQLITPLAAFATAVAILHNNPKWTTEAVAAAPPRQAVSLPPTMGKAAAYGGGNVEGRVDHFTRAVVPRTTELSSRRQAAAAAAAGCGRII